MAKRKTPPRRGVWAAADSTPIAGAAAVTARAPPAFKSSRRVSEVMHASLPDDGTRILGAQIPAATDHRWVERLVDVAVRESAERREPGRQVTLADYEQSRLRRGGR